MNVVPVGTCRNCRKDLIWSRIDIKQICDIVNELDEYTIPLKKLFIKI